jgi:thermitase
LKRFSIALFALVFAVFGGSVPATGDEGGGSYQGERVAYNQLIVSFDAGVSDSELESFMADVARRYEQLTPLSPNTYLVTTKLFLSIADQIKLFEASELVEFAEPNGIVYLDDVDPEAISSFSAAQWGLGAGFGANAAAAWADYQGNENVYVAVLDSGIDFSHPDLSGVKFVNSAPGASGYEGDVNGWDFVNRDGTVFDANENFHGTHVAGTISATGDTGVTRNTKLISVKMINAFGSATTANAIEAIDYVTILRTQNGVDITATNASWGGPTYSRAMEQAIQRGGDAGIIFVAAAGNDRNNNDGDGHNPAETYPASYDCSTPDRPWNCVVAVAAHDTAGALASFSSFGSTTVMLTAPGEGIRSTMPGGGYEAKNGTSMAAPHVSGALAMCVGANRGVSAERAIELLQATVTKDDRLAGVVSTGGRLNTKALADSCFAERAGAQSGVPTFHVASATYTNRIRLDWQNTVVGEYKLQIQKAIGPAGCSNQAVWLHHAWIGPGLVGYPATGLQESQFHCFRVRAWRDGVSSAWATSNVSITWTSNLPFLYGKILTHEGTPVANMPVRWRPFGSSAAGNISTVTNASGDYVLQVPNGVMGNFFVETSNNPIAALPSTPLTPWGLVASGALAIDNDSEVDFTLPAIDYLNIRVVSEADNTPVAGAVINAMGSTSRNCNAGAFFAFFTGAEKPNNLNNCREVPFGLSRGPVTDANGEVTVAILSHSYFRPVDSIWRFSATHPNDKASVVIHDLDTKTIAGGEIDIEMRLGPSAQLSGRVLTDDGAPVSGMPVKWAPAGGSSAQNITSISNASGEYSLRIPTGVLGNFFVETTNRATGGSPTTPRTPWGMIAAGAMTISGDTELDFNLPAIDYIKIKVVQWGTEEPIAGARISPMNSPSRNCDTNLGRFFPFFTGAVKPVNQNNCRQLPFGLGGNPATNSDGEATVAVIASQYFRPVDTLWSFSATHPNDLSNVALATVQTAEIVGGEVEVVMVLGEPVDLTGQVLTASGVPVSNIPIRWRPFGASAGTVSMVTNANGEYSLRVPKGVMGNLFVETSQQPGRATPTNPLTPWGMTAAGGIAVTEDSVLNFVLPEYDLIKVRVTEWGSNDPVAGAIIRPLGNTSRNCDANLGRFFPFFDGAVKPSNLNNCRHVPFGLSDNPFTDANGEVTIAVLKASYMRPVDTLLSFSATHPLDRGRVMISEVQTSDIVGGEVSVEMVLPGTPSKPEQPTAFAEEGAVTLTWTEPWNGGAFIDYYQVWMSLAAEGPFELVTTGSCAGNIDPALRSCEVTGLQGGVPYFFAIIAYNVVGASEMSISTMSTPLVSVQDFAVVGNPVISGTAQVGSSLTVTVGSWDAGVDFVIQWFRGDEAIVGANSASYELQDVDLGELISARVTGSKTGFNTVVRMSAQTSPVQPLPLSNFALIGAAAVSGSAIVGQTLTGAAGNWDAGVTLSFRWLSEGGPIAGATSSSLVLTEDLLGEVLTFEVTAEKDGYRTVSVNSVSTAMVSLPAPVLQQFVLTPTPEIIGDPIVGDVLGVRLGQWDAGVARSYRWLRDGVPILGATGLSYTVSDLDLGHELSFEVTASKAGFETVNLVAAATEPVVGALVAETVQRGPIAGLTAPVIAGAARVGATLTKAGSMGQLQAQAVTVFEYQWLRNGVAIFGATGVSYEPHATDLGAMLSLRVTALRDGYDPTTLVSAEVGPILEREVEVIGGGGGGGGGGGFAPPVAAALPVMNRALPAGVAGAVMGADGRALQAAVTVDAAGKGISFAGSGWRIGLSAQSGLSVSETGGAQLAAGSRVAIWASGYEPGSEVQAYLVPKAYLQLAAFSVRIATLSAEPIALGSTTVSATGEFELALSVAAPAGDYQLQLVGKTMAGDVVTLAVATTVTGSASLRGWAARAAGASTAKIYARGVLGAGKVTFVVNGREVAWVRAADTSDPKLRIPQSGPMAGVSYLVRTVPLVAGKNVIEIYVEGERVRRVAYTR